MHTMPPPPWTIPKRRFKLESESHRIPGQDAVHRQEPINNKSLQAGSVLPSGAYLQRLHLSDGSSSQGEFNISDLNDCDKMNNWRI